ncbi:hypothetical protein K491DRAFT_674896 [Lophiostoma macrostomum CBS 122681]|uniref:F-box domain-containing protein n=1 Tax=Lophiostoma macrostomum CBS 122681 TaxID=1314788 RepID=A0A6A6TNC8_9PLEO|nr:hypothetical protein K491DRAFT_674896 [Lophiostoma macrostomum CBS 122681]
MDNTTTMPIRTESALERHQKDDRRISVPSATSIDNLPNELLLAVAGYLDLRSRTRLNLVNQRFGEIARDIIYNTVRLPDPWSGSEMDIPRLHRTLDNQIHLAQRVRRLCIQPVDRYVNLDARNFLRLPCSAQSLISSGIFGAHMSEPVLTSAILTLLPGLRHLDISFWREQSQESYEVAEYYSPASNTLEFLFGIPTHENWIRDRLLDIPGL